MSVAVMVSPFTSGMGHEPWIMWSKKEPLSSLQTQSQTDGRSVIDTTYIEPDENIPHIQVPQANRYHAVLSKLNQAARNTGKFSSWNS